MFIKFLASPEPVNLYSLGNWFIVEIDELSPVATFNKLTLISVIKKLSTSDNLRSLGSTLDAPGANSLINTAKSIVD